MNDIYPNKRCNGYGVHCDGCANCKPAALPAPAVSEAPSRVTPEMKRALADGQAAIDASQQRRAARGLSEPPSIDTPIQRYGFWYGEGSSGVKRTEEGQYVAYADHLQHVAAAERRGAEAERARLVQTITNANDTAQELLRQRDAAEAELAKLRAQVPQADAGADDWQSLTKAGQVKVGDRLRFTIGDKTYNEVAMLILHAGTDKEEVIYNRRRNYYFITGCVLSGFSNHKNMQVVAAKQAGKEA